MIKKTIKVSDNNFRKFDDPLGNVDSRKYIFYARTCDVPEGIPMATNPRDQKLKSPVANTITESLESNDGLFHLKNRGIVLSAKRVRYDNRMQVVTIEFDDESCHGNIDGGHTYKILLENKDKILDQYVQFEVMTGVEGMIADLAEARNTSVAVDAKSMAELREKFDPIKEGLEGMPFFERISFKQNQITRDIDTNKALKMIDARDIVSIICMFDIDRYGSTEHPIKAYSGKQAMLNEYLEDPEHYRKFVNVIPDIFDLYEAIETEFAIAYNENGRMYGRKSYSGYKDGNTIGKSKFGQRDICYKIPDGLIYPILASFRSLLEYDTSSGLYKWINGKDPISAWNRHKNSLTKSTMDLAGSLGDKPTVFGKDTSLWNYVYMVLSTLEGSSFV
ncbi:MAG: abortive phage infection protein [Clostridiaceae bacterium]|nr:abortive phage infection protein [Clostridiaceae bacterium]